MFSKAIINKKNIYTHGMKGFVTNSGPRLSFGPFGLATGDS